jgi:hypothetical protein
MPLGDAAERDEANTGLVADPVCSEAMPDFAAGYRERLLTLRGINQHPQ